MQANVTTRRASAEDQAAIKALIRAVGINPLGIHWQRFLIAEDANGQLVGCGQIKPHRDGSRELASIAVSAEFRHQGIATHIIRELMAAAEPPLWLTCMSSRASLYERFGFVQVADRSDMPPYFRRAHRLFPLFQTLTRDRSGHYLAVMRWTNSAE